MSRLSVNRCLCKFVLGLRLLGLAAPSAGAAASMLHLRRSLQTTATSSSTACNYTDHRNTHSFECTLNEYCDFLNRDNNNNNSRSSSSTTAPSTWECSGIVDSQYTLAHETLDGECFEHIIGDNNRPEYRLCPSVTQAVTSFDGYDIQKHQAMVQFKHDDGIDVHVTVDYDFCNGVPCACQAAVGHETCASCQLCGDSISNRMDDRGLFYAVSLDCSNIPTTSQHSATTSLLGKTCDEPWGDFFLEVDQANAGSITDMGPSEISGTYSVGTATVTTTSSSSISGGGMTVTGVVVLVVIILAAVCCLGVCGGLCFFLIFKNMNNNANNNFNNSDINNDINNTKQEPEPTAATIDGASGDGGGTQAIQYA